MAAAMATAVVSEPPRPSVVTLPFSSTPWKPAITAICFLFSTSKMRSASMERMRAFEKVLSVTMRHWWPRKLWALPRARRWRSTPARWRLLSGGEDDVLFALVGPIAQLPHQLQQPVGLPRHRRDDDDDVVALLAGGDGLAGDVLDSVDVSDRGASVLHHDERHSGRLHSPGGRGTEVFRCGESLAAEGALVAGPRHDHASCARRQQPDPGADPEVSVGLRPVALTAEARARVTKARELVDRVAAGDEPAYGINTGFGTLAEVHIDRKDLAELPAQPHRQPRGRRRAPMPVHEARALLLLRCNVLAKGFSGVRPSTLDSAWRC